jgi:hypothetical protein
MELRVRQLKEKFQQFVLRISTQELTESELPQPSSRGRQQYVVIESTMVQLLLSLSLEAILVFTFIGPSRGHCVTRPLNQELPFTLKRNVLLVLEIAKSLQLVQSIILKCMWRRLRNKCCPKSPTKRDWLGIFLQLPFVLLFSSSLMET